MVDFAEAEITALRSSIQRLGIFLRIDTPDPVRLWLGVGDIEPGADVFDPSGARYLGIGALRDVPTFNQVINGKAERLTLSLSGVTEDVLLAFILGDVEAVKHRRVVIGLGILAESWSHMLGPIHWLWHGKVDYPEFSSEPARDPNEPAERTIGVSVSTLMTGRRRASKTYWTDPDQKRISPDDRFCERVSALTEFRKDWPKL